MSAMNLTRRLWLAGTATTLAAPSVRAAPAPIKVGLMLPYSGTFAQLGEAITNGFELYLGERGGTLGGRPISIVRLDDMSDPAAAPQNANRLLSRDKADVLVGTVHSGVVMALVQAAREKGTLLIIPNAGNVAASRNLCAENIFRSSFTNWQPAYGMGLALAKTGVKKAAWVTWDYAAGKESGDGFRDGLKAGGAELVTTLTLPFPETNFQPLLAQLPGLGVDAVGSFFAGGGAVQFVRDYAAAGLKDKIPLCGSGFLTEGVLGAQGAAADGVRTALHYGDGLDLPKNKTFRDGYQTKFGRPADVYAVQGYDAGQILAVGLDAVAGDVEADQKLSKAITAATIDSPRGKFTLGVGHSPVQDIYLREAKGGENKVIGVAAPQLADPATGCKNTA